MGGAGTVYRDRRDRTNSTYYNYMQYSVSRTKHACMYGMQAIDDSCCIVTAAVFHAYMVLWLKISV